MTLGTPLSLREAISLFSGLKKGGQVRGVGAGAKSQKFKKRGRYHKNKLIASVLVEKNSLIGQNAMLRVQVSHLLNWDLKAVSRLDMVWEPRRHDRTL